MKICLKTYHIQQTKAADGKPSATNLFSIDWHLIQIKNVINVWKIAVPFLPS